MAARERGGRAVLIATRGGRPAGLRACMVVMNEPYPIDALASASRELGIVRSSKGTTRTTRMIVVETDRWRQPDRRDTTYRMQGGCPKRIDVEQCPQCSGTLKIIARPHKRRVS
jgi:hypothetical protein